MDIELRRIRLAEIRALAYLHQFAGVLSAEAHLVQTATSLQISTESVIDEWFMSINVGDVGLGRNLVARPRRNALCEQHRTRARR